MSDIASDHAVPPDLPPEMLTEISDVQLGSGQRPAASPPGPDLPAEMLTQAQPASGSVTEPAGPGLAAEFLTAASWPDPGEIPSAGPRRGRSNEQPIAEGTDAEALGPSHTIPLSEDDVQLDHGLSFEATWDSLARRLQGSSTVADGGVPPIPPDLPDEMLRPPGHADASEDHDESLDE